MIHEDLRPVWLPAGTYPQFQKTFYTVGCEESGYCFCVVEFHREYTFEKPVRALKALVCADTRFRLWNNDTFIGCGPVAGGGDFLLKRPLCKQYCNEYALTPGSRVRFFAQVYLSPDVLTDYSCGQGCFALRLTVEYEDGTTSILHTDDSWQCRLNPAYHDTCHADFTLKPHEWTAAEPVQSVWNFTKAPIPMLQETFVKPQTPVTLQAAPGQTVRTAVEFDRIYSGYVCFDVHAAGPCEITVETYELPDTIVQQEHIRCDGPLSYRGLRLQSLGGYFITVKNESDQSVSLDGIGQIFTCYPVTQEGDFSCSDAMLTRIYRLCKHTLKICRQTLHLDSPLHQEPLACTGDYYIESLMNYYTFGDPRLTRLDIVRTADILLQNDGVMFHTTYSLIWVQMLWDYYQYTADRSIFAQTAEALNLLLERFTQYLGDNGLIENPPDYMFMDWIEIDGFSLHHPPKALGQTVLNAFYYKALTTAVQIAHETGAEASAQIWNERARALKQSFELLYNAERGLYVSGLTTPENHPGPWLPQNTDRVYYTRQANVLAVLYDLCAPDRAQKIMHQVLTGEWDADIQPYFMHFLLDAVAKTGLFAEHGLPLLHWWDKQVLECEKGLKEGWGSFRGDYSHAWGGTPAYQLPKRLLGLEMIRPGFAEIALDPCLYGLQSADIAVPTPYGMITCRMEQGCAPVLSVPQEITVRYISKSNI